MATTRTQGTIRTSFAALRRTWSELDRGARRVIEINAEYPTGRTGR